MESEFAATQIAAAAESPQAVCQQIFAALEALGRRAAK
jgi:hypothetical protein